MGDGTLRLERQWTALTGTGGAALAGANEPWTIAIDGTAVGALAPKETVEVAVAPGHHTLRLGQGRHMRPERSFDIDQDEVVSSYCHVPDTAGHSSWRHSSRAISGSRCTESEPGVLRPSPPSARSDWRPYRESRPAELRGGTPRPAPAGRSAPGGAHGGVRGFLPGKGGRGGT